ncbi:hypothetical protein D3C71_1506680 [compost metagenome]
MPVGAHPAVCVAVCCVVAVLVAIGAGDGDGFEVFAVGGAGRAYGLEHQAAFLHRGHGVVLLGQAGKEVQITLARLVDVFHRGVG